MKIYKITEASKYLGISINSLKRENMRKHWTKKCTCENFQQNEDCEHIGDSVLKKVRLIDMGFKDGCGQPVLVEEIMKTEQVFCKGDCFDLIPKIYKENSFELILVDAPYMIGYAEWDKKFDVAFLSSEFYRILKPNGSIIFFAGWSNVCEVINKFDKKFKLNDWIIYDRIKGRGAKRKLVSTREDILWFVKSKDYIFNKTYSTIKKKTGGMGLKNGQSNRCLSNVWTDISPIVPWSKERVSHPTQKPLQLIERIVKIFSNEGDTILDCFMGSGTTLVACKNLNRNCCGIEISSEYCEITRKRLENTL